MLGELNEVEGCYAKNRELQTYSTENSKSLSKIPSTLEYKVILLWVNVEIST